MSKFVLILLIAFIAYLFLRNVLRRFRSANSNLPGQKSEIKENENKDSGKVIDAKFEEIK